MGHPTFFQQLSRVIFSTPFFTLVDKQEYGPLTYFKFFRDLSQFLLKLLCLNRLIRKLLQRIIFTAISPAIYLYVILFRVYVLIQHDNNESGSKILRSVFLRLKIPKLIVPTNQSFSCSKFLLLQIPTVRSSYDSEFQQMQSSNSSKFLQTLKVFMQLQYSYQLKIPTVASSYGSVFFFSKFLRFKVPTVQNSYGLKFEVPTGPKSYRLPMLNYSHT